MLQEQGERIEVLKLQGYIFLGTAAQLVERLRHSLEAKCGAESARDFGLA